MKRGEDYTGVAVVYFCHDGKGNFLLNKRGVNCRDEHGTWDPGGGGIEFGDTVENSLRKEIKEEYCTDVINRLLDWLACDEMFVYFIGHFVFCLINRIRLFRS